MVGRSNESEPLPDNPFNPEQLTLFNPEQRTLERTATGQIGDSERSTLADNSFYRGYVATLASLNSFI